MQKLLFNLKKGFLSIELCIIGSLVLTFAIIVFFKTYPSMVQDVAESASNEVGRFDTLPDSIEKPD